MTDAILRTLTTGTGLRFFQYGQIQTESDQQVKRKTSD